MSQYAECAVCFRHCVIGEGKRGVCGARTCRDGKVVAENYGQITALALDPIEKKPLRRFHPGEYILSVGSYGCDLLCPFCQNHEIARPQGRPPVRRMTPRQLADLTVSCREQGSCGLAFTYNEPLVGYEFVRDTAKLVKQEGLVNVMVTNGTAEPAVLEELLPYIDAMNIDLKGFTDRFYRDVVKGRRQTVLDFIERAAARCHVEITTLIIPGENDSEEEIRQMSRWIASLTDGEGRINGRDIPLHITRFFPQFRMTDRPATDVERVYGLAEAARSELRFVYTGNC